MRVTKGAAQYAGPFTPPTQPFPDGSADLPVANAGPDQNVADNDGSTDETVTLNGGGSTPPQGGSIVSYEWSEGGNSLGTGVEISPTFSVGVHTVTLKVTDQVGSMDTDDVTVTVQANQDPVADAGPDQEHSVAQSDDTVLVTLDGTGSTDPNGGAITSYSWSDGTSEIGTTATLDVTVRRGRPPLQPDGHGCGRRECAGRGSGYRHRGD